MLGIFGQQGVYSADEWPLASNERFIGGAFNMFRNFDGHGATFGDTSIKASNDDVADSSIYASLDSTNHSLLTLVAINKTAAALPARMSLAHVLPGSIATVYTLTSGSSTPVAAGTFTITDPSNFTYSMPANSVSTIRITIVAQAVTASSFQYQTSPNTIKVTFNEDVSASLATGDLIITPLAGGSAPVQHTAAWMQTTSQHLHCPAHSPTEITAQQSPPPP